MPPIAISKTRVLSYMQCPRRLWLEQYSPELEDESAIDQAAIDTGRVVGEMARQVYGISGGHLVSHDRGLRSAVSETEELIAAGGNEPIFEATFDYDGLTVLVDILDRSGPAPRLVEVKAATSVKDHYLADIAIQSWTLQKLGVEPAASVLALIDSSFSYSGNKDYTGLFHEVDLTPDLDGLVAQIPELVDGTRQTLDSLDEPERQVGTHCTTPHRCPFFDHCAPDQGEFPILGLGGRKEPLYELMHAGFSDIRELSEEQLSNETHQRIRKQTVTGEVFRSENLREQMQALAWPRYFFDFETISFAVPIWPDTRPYQALPFQWSVHVDTGDGHIRHYEFLDLSGDAPMRQAAESLLQQLGEEGPILVYSSYEKRILNELAERYPDLGDRLHALVERLVDLLPIAKAGYYHPAMRGSWSIKAVLPTIDSGIDYSQLDEVQDGGAAQTAYLEAIHPETSADRRASLDKALREYCKLDTLSLVRLVEFFSR